MSQIVSNEKYILIVLGCALVTYLPRMLPLVVLSKKELNKNVLKFLDYIPICILGALLVPELVMKDNQLDISLSNEFLIAGVLTIIVARYTKKLVYIVLAGIVFMILLRMIV